MGFIVLTSIVIILHFGLSKIHQKGIIYIITKVVEALTYKISSLFRNKLIVFDKFKIIKSLSSNSFSHGTFRSISLLISLLSMSLLISIECCLILVFTAFLPFPKKHFLLSPLFLSVIDLSKNFRLLKSLVDAMLPRNIMKKNTISRRTLRLFIAAWEFVENKLFKIEIILLAKGILFKKLIDTMTIHCLSLQQWNIFSIVCISSCYNFFFVFVLVSVFLFTKFICRSGQPLPYWC